MLKILFSWQVFQLEAQPDCMDWLWRSGCPVAELLLGLQSINLIRNVSFGRLLWQVLKLYKSPRLLFDFWWSCHLNCEVIKLFFSSNNTILQFQTFHSFSRSYGNYAITNTFCLLLALTHNCGPSLCTSIAKSVLQCNLLIVFFHSHSIYSLYAFLLSCFSGHFWTSCGNMYLYCIAEFWFLCMSVQLTDKCVVVIF